MQWPSEHSFFGRYADKIGGGRAQNGTRRVVHRQSIGKVVCDDRSNKHFTGAKQVSIYLIPLL